MTDSGMGPQVKVSGQEYEERAAEWLHDQGLAVLARNFRARTGEIDIIAREHQTLVFVEVRVRHNPHFASAAASVTRAKQMRVVRTAQWYLQTRPALARLPCRFDVIAFQSPESGNAPGIHWIRGAFTA